MRFFVCPANRVTSLFFIFKFLLSFIHRKLLRLRLRRWLQKSHCRSNKFIVLIRKPLLISSLYILIEMFQKRCSINANEAQLTNSHFPGSRTSGQRQRGPEASSRGEGGGTSRTSAARHPTSEIAVGFFVPELRNVR